MAIPSNKAEQEMFDLIEACRTGEASTDTSNRFYGKVEERLMETSDFYHPALDRDKPDLYNSAIFLLDQVRVGDISEQSYKSKYESIRSLGIQSAGWALLDQDPNSKWQGRVLDAVTRVVLARTCEENEHVESSIPVPMYVITDPTLIRLIMKNKMSFQTLVNDHPPADASSAHDVKKFIRTLVDREQKPSKEHTKNFKTKLTEHVHRMVRTNKTYETVRNYVSEIYNSLEQSNNGVKGFIEPTNRASIVRKALESGKGTFKVDATKWTESKKEYTHEDHKIYQGSPTKGVLIKDFGREIERKSGGEDTRLSVYVFRTDAKTPEKVREAQVAVFDKINKMHTWLGKTIFDKVFALGQVTGVDEGKLLSETDVRAARAKLKVVNE